MKQRNVAFRTVAVLFALIAVGVGTHAEKDNRVEERKSTASYKFVNASEQAAHGLHVKLSSPAIVVTTEDGKAGPFGNVSGNDTSHIVLGNPGDAISAGDTVELSFKSYKKQLRATGWWWVDERGKRVGDKQK